MTVEACSSLAMLLVLHAGSSSLKFSLYSADLPPRHPVQNIGHCGIPASSSSGLG